MVKCIEGTVAGLSWVNKSNNNCCVIDNMVPNWKTILANYMKTHYLKCVSFDVNKQYYIAIDYLRDDDCSHDTLDVLKSANIVIYSIDYIVDTITIGFKDEQSRDLVFNVLNVW